MGRHAALATGSCKFFGEWKMYYGETCRPPTSPTRQPKMTPDPFMCLYQAVEVRNSDESLWLCVYTVESRKEGNQPRSAKSGEVRENGCSLAKLQRFTPEPEFISHHLCKDLHAINNSDIMAGRQLLTLAARGKIRQ